MTSRASSTTKQSTKKRTTNKAAPSTAVETKVPPLRDRLHPGILASAMDLAGGDSRRIEVVSYSSVMVTTR